MCSEIRIVILQSMPNNRKIYSQIAERIIAKYPNAFLASEEYAKESIKDLKLNPGSVLDENATGSTFP